MLGSTNPNELTAFAGATFANTLFDYDPKPRMLALDTYGIELPCGATSKRRQEDQERVIATFGNAGNATLLRITSCRWGRCVCGICVSVRSAKATATKFGFLNKYRKQRINFVLVCFAFRQAIQKRVLYPPSRNNCTCVHLFCNCPHRTQVFNPLQQLRFSWKMWIEDSATNPI
eukprot:g406.t1